MQPTELVSISCESARVRSQELADLERSRANEPRIVGCFNPRWEDRIGWDLETNSCCFRFLTILKENKERRKGARALYGIVCSAYQPAFRWGVPLAIRCWRPRN
jgi:hypothetical protein